MSAPGYWIFETSGALRPAIEAYLEGDEMTPAEIALIRAYLRQWIFAPAWIGPEIDVLRAGIDRLTSRAAIKAWLHHGLKRGDRSVMRISSFPSIIGETWVLSDGYCVLGYCKSKSAAEKLRAAINREKRERRKKK